MTRGQARAHLEDFLASRGWPDPLPDARIIPDDGADHDDDDTDAYEAESWWFDLIQDGGRHPEDRPSGYVHPSGKIEGLY